MTAVESVRALRDSLPESHEWDERELALLTLAEHQAADIDALEEDIAKHGVRLASGRLNAAAREVRQGRVSLGRILALVNVPGTDRPTVVHARQAARSRWGTK
jgi:hypothetical protein